MAKGSGNGRGALPNAEIVEAKIAELLRLGMEQHRAGHLSVAESIYRQVLEIAPGNADAHHLAGLLAHQVGEDQAAATLIGQAVGLAPEEPRFRASLASVLMRLGRTGDAQTHLRRAARLAPADPEIRVAHAQCLLAQQQGPAAERELRQALDLNPDHALANMNLGTLLVHSGRMAEAEPYYRRAAQAAPSNPQCTSNLGNLLLLLGRPVEAVDWARRTVALTPDVPAARVRLARMQLRSGALADAEAECATALTLAPDDGDALTAMGEIQLELGRPAEAEALLTRAIARHPSTDQPRSLRALARLAQGNYRDGFADYEARRTVAPRIATMLAAMPYPEWEGDSLAGRTIVVVAEQGFGDAVQFARYVPLLAERGGRAVVRCPPPVARLLATVAGADAVVPEDAPLPTADCFVPMASLPLRLGTERPDAVPVTIPYLSVEPAAATRWRDRLGGHPGLKVGVVWHTGGTNPELGTDHEVAKRSMRLADLAPVLATAGVTVFSLQKDRPEGELPATMIDLAPELGDFADTAAAMAALDLVISIDTAAAHVAGATGRPLWVLAPYGVGWRWRDGGAGNTWYPQARVFRAEAGQSWPEVAAVAAAALSKLAAGPNP